MHPLIFVMSMMKFSSLFSNSFPLLRTVLITSVLTLTGCSLGMSSEIKTAETMLNHFECKNIESTELVHSPITNYHEHALSASKDKATTIWKAINQVMYCLKFL